MEEVYAQQRHCVQQAGDVSDDEQDELSQQDEDMHATGASSGGSGGTSHRRLKEGSGVNPAQDGPIAEMEELALGGGSAPSTGLTLLLLPLWYIGCRCIQLAHC